MPAPFSYQEFSGMSICGFICSFFEYCFNDYIPGESLPTGVSWEKREQFFLKGLGLAVDETKATRHGPYKDDMQDTIRECQMTESPQTD